MTEHILVVDDEPDLEHVILMVFKKKIRAQKFKFSFALNGVQALEKLNQHPEIDVVLTDLNMPEMDGMTLLQEIKSLSGRIKAVVISAYGDLENIRRAMNLGAFDFLVKPINLKDLEITLSKTLEEAAMIKQAAQDREQIIELKKELDIAQQLQLSMMPDLPTQAGPFYLGGQIRLSSKVGGDFLDIIPLDDDEVLVVLGDCSGHGLGSALIMSAIRHSLRTLATQIRDYRDFIDPLNRIVYQEFGYKHRYATMIFLHIQLNNPVIRLLRAGHETPLLRRKGNFLPTDWRGGLPIGLLPKRDKDEWVEWELDKDDELYLYTDGVPDGLPHMDVPMRELLEKNKNLASHLDKQKFFSYLGKDHQWQNLDDATLLKIQLGSA